MSDEQIETDLKKTFFQQVLGPRGGLFALGIFFGMFFMHAYMTKFVVQDLKSRIEVLEQSNAVMNKALQDIAFDKIANKE